MSIEEIRARCGASITEMVSGPKEYGQSQQIIRDRAVLLAAYDALAASRDERSAQLIEAERRNVAIAAEVADFRSRLAESCGHRIVANDRIRELEGALRELRTCNETGCKLCFACLLHIERHVTPAEAPVRHAVTCKLFPDPFDERDSVGPCTCGATSETPAEQGCEHCGSFEVNPKCPACQGIER